MYPAGYFDKLENLTCDGTIFAAWISAAGSGDAVVYEVLCTWVSQFVPFPFALHSALCSLLSYMHTILL